MIPTRLAAVGTNEVEKSVQADLDRPDPAPAVAALIINENTLEEEGDGVPRRDN